MFKTPPKGFKKSNNEQQCNYCLYYATSICKKHWFSIGYYHTNSQISDKDKLNIDLMGCYVCDSYKEKLKGIKGLIQMWSK